MESYFFIYYFLQLKANGMRYKSFFSRHTQMLKMIVAKERRRDPPNLYTYIYSYILLGLQVTEDVSNNGKNFYNPYIYDLLKKVQISCFPSLSSVLLRVFDLHIKVKNLIFTLMWEYFMAVWVYEAFLPYIFIGNWKGPTI